MAKNWTDEVSGGNTVPSSIGNIGTKTTWGIQNTIANCIIQSESIQSEDITDDTQDQNGATVSRLTYDKHWTLNLTLLTDEPSAITALQGTDNFAYGTDNGKWFVNSVVYNGSYNGKKSYNITAERYSLFPSQS